MLLNERFLFWDIPTIWIGSILGEILAKYSLPLDITSPKVNKVQVGEFDIGGRAINLSKFLNPM